MRFKVCVFFVTSEESLNDVKHNDWDDAAEKCKNV